MTSIADIQKTALDQDMRWARIAQRVQTQAGVEPELGPRFRAMRDFLNGYWSQVLTRLIEADVPPELEGAAINELLATANRKLYPSARAAGFPESSFLFPDIELSGVVAGAIDWDRTFKSVLGIMSIAAPLALSAATGVPVTQAAQVAVKAADTLEAAKGGDAKAKAKIAQVAAMARAGDPAAKETVKTLKVVSKAQDLKLAKSSSAYGAGLTVVGHLPYQVVGYERVTRGNRESESAFRARQKRAADNNPAVAAAREARAGKTQAMREQRSYDKLLRDNQAIMEENYRQATQVQPYNPYAGNPYGNPYGGLPAGGMGYNPYDPYGLGANPYSNPYANPLDPYGLGTLGLGGGYGGFDPLAYLGPVVGAVKRVTKVSRGGSGRASPTRPRVTAPASHSVQRDRSTGFTGQAEQAQRNAFPGAVPENPATWPPGMVWNPSAKRWEPNPAQPQGGSGQDPWGGMPPFDPYGMGMPPMGMPPMGGGGGFDPFAGVYAQPPPYMASPMQEVWEQPMPSAGLQTYDPATNSFYSDQVQMEYDPDTNSFGAKQGYNPYADAFSETYGVDPRMVPWVAGWTFGPYRSTPDTLVSLDKSPGLGLALREVYNRGLGRPATTPRAVVQAAANRAGVGPLARYLP